MIGSATGYREDETAILFLFKMPDKSRQLLIRMGIIEVAVSLGLRDNGGDSSLGQGCIHVRTKPVNHWWHSIARELLQIRDN